MNSKNSFVKKPINSLLRQLFTEYEEVTGRYTKLTTDGNSYVLSVNNEKNIFTSEDALINRLKSDIYSFLNSDYSATNNIYKTIDINNNKNNRAEDDIKM